MSLKNKVEALCPDGLLIARAKQRYLKRSQIRSEFFLGINKPYSNKLTCCLSGCACHLTSFVWVSHKHKLLFFEVPKAASTSVKEVFNIKLTPRIRAVHIAKQLREKDLSISGWRRFGVDSRVASEMVYANANIENLEVPCCDSDFFHVFMSPDEALAAYPGYASFASIREPIGRGISAFKMFCRKHNSFRTGQGAMIFKRCPWTMTLGDYIDMLHTHPNHHFLPQVDFLPTDTSQVNYFLKLEDMADDVKAFTKGTGVHLDIGHKNKTSSKVDISEADELRLYLYYRKDCEQLPYSSKVGQMK